EYDFVVRSGADPSVIALDFQGAEALDITGQGDLVLQLPDGGTLQQSKPVVYQMVKGVRHAIAAGYVRKTAHQIGFRVSAYDRRQPLVIDPAYLAYSTYLGGSLGDAGDGYVTGATFASDFPTAGDAVQPAFCPNPTDPTSCGTEVAFIAKIAPNGNNSTDLVYSTFLGGNFYSAGTGIAVGPSGCAYV